MGSLYYQAFDSCGTYWWTNLLLINNFYPAGLNGCMWWTWILSVCFQLYVVLPFVILVMRKNSIIGYSLMGFLMLVSMVSRVVPSCS